MATALGLWFHHLLARGTMKVAFDPLLPLVLYPLVLRSAQTDYDARRFRLSCQPAIAIRHSTTPIAACARPDVSVKATTSTTTIQAAQATASILGVFIGYPVSIGSAPATFGDRRLTILKPPSICAPPVVCVLVRR